MQILQKKHADAYRLKEDFSQYTLAKKKSAQSCDQADNLLANDTSAPKRRSYRSQFLRLWRPRERYIHHGAYSALP